MACIFGTCDDGVDVACIFGTCDRGTDVACIFDTCDGDVDVACILSTCDGGMYEACIFGTCDQVRMCRPSLVRVIESCLYRTYLASVMIRGMDGESSVNRIKV